MSGERTTSTNHNLWLIAGVAIIAPFMEVLDTSIANVALPYIAGNLSASLDESVWVLTSYLVANAVVLPVSGWISGRMGRKRFYLLSILLFTLSSFFCGIAPSLPILILFRVLQGLGGGGLQPTTQAILADLFPKERIAAAFTLYSVVIVLAPTLGPVMGGWLSDHWGWRWIFFLNIPCGIAAYFLNRALQPEAPQDHTRDAPIDYAGLLGIAVGLGCLEYVLDRGERSDWFASPAISTAAILSCVALLFLVHHELFRAKHPVLQMRLLTNRNFALACGMAFFTYFARYASTALLPEFTHGMLGYTATESGLVLSPGSFALLLFLPLTTWLMKRIDHRILIVSGLMVTTFAFHQLTGLTLQVDYGTIVKLRILESSGVALFLTPLSVLAFSRLKSGKNDAAASLYGLFRNLGSAIGISIVNTMLVRGVQIHRTYLVQNLPPSSMELAAAVQARASYLHAFAGDSSTHAARRALGQIQDEINRQALLLCYADCFRLLMYVSVALSPVAFFFLVRERSGPTVTQSVAK
ncbi:MFS transporter, DHA2 family, multidrug resistance protein [Bryocella elongata]|uniref:MFS transporter, DHA2 family, multidrug resistance protein n=1 Tax=Bryocella elongata TaxID=863522 RepID=A0A1H5WTN0_9BACT|nr:DHA2 family efflux MFS transporter permease subunit [Bryocella elongata]SEG02788.1 MFS transporter, DHA2 family, multidrug resistance protein [Bryocella elongata]